MHKILLNGLNEDEFRTLVKESFREQLDSIKNDSRVTEDRLLSRDETVKLLGITHPTLHDWTFNKNILNGYRMGRRIYYKYNEVMESLKSINQKKCD